MIRRPAVAGYFYPSQPDQLRAEISGFLSKSKKVMPKGIIVPHAGYRYSGKVAGEVYSLTEIPDRVIILSPNHTGLGVPFSIMVEGAFSLPLGDAPIDSSLAQSLLSACSLLKPDVQAQTREHALEVQLPFLQFLKKDFSFVPITIAHVRFEDCEKLGNAIADVILRQSSPILMVASSDMNHFEDQRITMVKDQAAIDEILERRPRALYDVVREKSISMCGVMPVTTMLVAANRLGATKATLIAHKTSGDVTGDMDSVVGYAGMMIE
jgi:AmmeMemoRadiSam system protein B